MHPFRTFIHRYEILTEATWQAVEKCLDQQALKTGDFILKEGQICHHIHFLESGLMRYFILRNGEEQTKFFTISP